MEQVGNYEFPTKMVHYCNCVLHQLDYCDLRKLEPSSSSKATLYLFLFDVFRSLVDLGTRIITGGGLAFRQIVVQLHTLFSWQHVLREEGGLHIFLLLSRNHNRNICNRARYFANLCIFMWMDSRLYKGFEANLCRIGCEIYWRAWSYRREGVYKPSNECSRHIGSSKQTVSTHCCAHIHVW